MYYKAIFQLIEKDTKMRDMLEACYTSTPSLPILEFPEENELYSSALGSKLNDWEFNALALSDAQLLGIVYLTFEKSKVIDYFQIDRAKLKHFILTVRNHYYNNPYHNFSHAVDVLQATYYIISRISEAAFLFRPLDIFGLLVAAYCHDIGHPGCNNFFMVNAKTSLAKMYHDSSVLEHYHLLILFSILENQSSNILSSLPPISHKELKAVMIDHILATDMALHFDFIARLMAASPSKPASSDAELDADRHPAAHLDRSLLFACILKCADISNISRDFYIHQDWVSRLVEEYTEQGRIESELNLPLHAFGDSTKYSTPKLQLDFYELFAAPLYRAIQAFLPETEFFMTALERNKTKWLELESSGSWVQRDRHESLCYAKNPAY